MTTKGVIVEFDFTALNGAEVLFDVARDFLSGLDGIVLDRPTEARYLAGVGYLDGITKLFEAVKTKKTAVKAARDLEDAFNARMTEMVPDAVGPKFKNFVKALTDADVKVIVCTHADICADRVRLAFEGLSDKITLHQETSSCYGTMQRNVWRLIAGRNRFFPASAVAVTGSGFGVRSALLSGMASMAVVSDHVVYQDFGGADECVAALDAAAAEKVLTMLRVCAD